MCTEKHWKSCNTSVAYHVATKFALELEEIAKINGYNPKAIKIKTKEEIIKRGLGKADAQVIWEEGPTEWAQHINDAGLHDADFVIEGNSVSFYNR